MATHRAYATDFIIEDLAESFFSAPSDQRKLYSKLVDVLRAGLLKVLVENGGVAKIEKLEKKKDEGEFERAKFELIESLISSGRINFSSDVDQIPDCLDSITMRTTHKKRFSPAADESISAALYDSLPESSVEEKIGQGLKKALIKKAKIEDGSIQYLFETNELDPIEKGEEFKWYRYLKPYGIHTNRVYIRDPYFYSNSLDNDLNDILGPLLYASYTTPINVEIISELYNPFGNKEDAIQRVKEWMADQDSRLNITCHYQRGNASSLFHDRYLFTDYWALKVPAGLDVEKDGKASSYTIPTMVGRYNPNGSTWSYINENWDDWKTKKCKLIN